MTRPLEQKPSLMKSLRTGKAAKPREKYHVTLVIEDLPALPNQLIYKHWRRAQREKDKWLILVGAHVFSSDPGRPLKPLAKANVRLVRHSPRACDPEAVAVSFKYVMDALVNTGVLAGDTHKHVTFEPPPIWVQCPKKTQHITVEVTEI